MQAQGVRTRIAVALALGVFAACAPATLADPVNDAAAPAGVAILVDYNLAGATMATVTLLEPGAGWQFLGTVNPVRVERFVLATAPVAGHYRLAAETVDGGRIVSRPFVLTGHEAVRWNMSTNTITPVRAGGEEAEDDG
jgi:hypothetical protein